MAIGPYMKRCLISASFLVLPVLAPSQANSANGLSESEAETLVMARFKDTCNPLPIGMQHLTLQTEVLTRNLNQLKALGLITITEIDRKTGNVWQDLGNMANDPMSALVRVDIAPGLPSSEVCTGNGKSGVRVGDTKFKEIIHFEPVRRTAPNGLPIETYIMQGLLDHEIRPLERRLNPGAQSISKFQATFIYDEFRKIWVLQNLQMVGLNQSFN